MKKEMKKNPISIFQNENFRNRDYPKSALPAPGIDSYFFIEARNGSLANLY
jgi:hypothetical protein